MNIGEEDERKRKKGNRGRVGKDRRNRRWEKERGRWNRGEYSIR
jgi:hypothetical protein